MIYEKWCRRIDLDFRSKYPHLHTELYKIDDFDFKLLVLEELKDFDEVEKIFDNEIRYITTPIKLVQTLPSNDLTKIQAIEDCNVYENISGLPLTLQQIQILVESIIPSIQISSIKENFESQQIIITIKDKQEPKYIEEIQSKTDKLDTAFRIKIIDGGTSTKQVKIDNEFFNILPSSYFKNLNCEFIERDEELWFSNAEAIYSGDYQKQDLYFFEKNKKSCLVNLSKFKNANIRNHLLLYDVVYCVLPLKEDMEKILRQQNITKNDLLEMISKGRIKILNMQPENRLDHGFLREAYQENKNGIVSRRALSALCAIDLVDINKSYIFNDAEIENNEYPLLKELSSLLNVDIQVLSNIFLWPKKALRSSVDILSFSGPSRIAAYGVNDIITSFLPEHPKKNAIEFEFIVNSDQIHIAHALDATYFPFFTDENSYSDSPYAIMMGNFLNFYANSSKQTMPALFSNNTPLEFKNPSLELISIFDTNEYISLTEFNSLISNKMLRNGLSSLFDELSILDGEERVERIKKYNHELNEIINQNKLFNNFLTLTEDGIGLFIPFMSTTKKVINKALGFTTNKYPTLTKISEYFESHLLPKDSFEKNISLLSKINRVARLKRL
nr:hypothetical protein [uncultured Tolumonas sp.]